MYNIELYVEDYGMIHFGLTKTVEGGGKIVFHCFQGSSDKSLWGILALKPRTKN